MVAHTDIAPSSRPAPLSVGSSVAYGIGNLGAGLVFAFANAALPLIQKQPADFNGAADLTRQCISVADPAGKVVGSCHLILGISTFQAAVAMDGDTEKNKSCDGAKKEAELVAEAKTSLTEAGKARPDAVAQYVSAIPQFEARTASMIKAYCK